LEFQYLFLPLYNKSRVTPLIVKADLKHPTYVYTGGESDF
jgi:hypothetical protein